MQAVDAAIGQLLVDPESWPAIDANFRRCRVSRFPFDIVFNIQDDEVLIFAVAHHHRKPDYWRKGRMNLWLDVARSPLATFMVISAR